MLLARLIKNELYENLEIYNLNGMLLYFFCMF